MSMINDILQSAVNNVQNSKDEFNKEEWGKAKQQDRDFAYKTQDEMATRITTNGEMYKTYLSDMRVKRQLNTIPFSKESVMKAVLSMSPVEVTVVENTSNGKAVNFNVDSRVIEVSENAGVEETIQGLVREIASIHTLSIEKSELNDFKNKSVAYMVCKRYGVPTKDFNFERIPEELKQMTPQEIKEELRKGRECFEILAEGMDKDVGMQNRNKTNREYER